MLGDDEDDVFFLLMSMREIADNQAERNETTISCKGMLARKTRYLHVIMIRDTGQDQTVKQFLQS